MGPSRLVRDFSLEMDPPDYSDASREYGYVLTMRPELAAGTCSNFDVWFNAPDPESAAEMVPDLIDSVEIHHGLKGRPVKLASREVRVVVIKEFNLGR